MKYIAGNTVQNKKSIISYKVKKFRKVNKQEHIRVDNTHEAIIDKDTFEKVNCIIEKRGTNTKLKYDYLLRGLLYCYHCKRKLQIVQKKNSKRSCASHPYITCSEAKERGCYPININYEKFEKHIIYIVKRICHIYSNKETLYSVYEKHQNKTESNNQTKELDKLIENFLKLEQIDKMYLYRLINKIEIDKDKNVYIYFYFSKLNSINENLDEFIKIEELIKKNNQKRKAV